VFLGVLKSFQSILNCFRGYFEVQGVLNTALIAIAATIESGGARSTKACWAMDCPKCGKLLTAVSADFVSETMYHVCLACCESRRIVDGDKESNGKNGKNGNGVTVLDFIRCLRILDTRCDEGTAARRLVRKLLLLCFMNRKKGGLHISLTDQLSSVVSRVREASGTSESNDMRVLLTGLSLLYLGGELVDPSTLGKPAESIEQEMPAPL